MNAVRNSYGYVLKSIKKDRTLRPIVENLKGQTFVVSGASRGIGFNIAEKLVKSGANVTILGKTTKEHPKLEGTIYSAADYLNNMNAEGHCLPIACDIRNPDNIDIAINQTIDQFQNIDGVVLNASALCLTDTLSQTDKQTMLMSNVNVNGTFMVGQRCLDHIVNSESGRVLCIAPPIEMLYTDDWWVNHLYYSISKFNMSLMAKFWDKEFPKIGVNTLWPRTTISTAPVKNILGGDEMVNISRTPDIMGEAAKHILHADPSLCTGKNFIDDEVLVSLDIDVEQFRVNKDISEKELMPDFFC